MTTFLGFPLLPLLIMGAPLLGVLISLLLPAPRHNTMPRNRRREEQIGISSHATPTTTSTIVG